MALDVLALFIILINSLHEQSDVSFLGTLVLKSDIDVLILTHRSFVSADVTFFESEPFFSEI